MEHLQDKIDKLQQRIDLLEKCGSEASKYVESVIAMRTGFTGNPPYVGWKGLGLALNEALNERDGLLHENATYTGWCREITKYFNVDNMEEVIDLITQR